jgi:hypothetical protein
VRGLTSLGLASATSSSSTPVAMDKFSRVQDDLDEATEIMRHNIERVVDRGEHLELLVDKSEGFSNSARQFQKHSSGLRQALWWKNFKTVAMCSSFAFTVRCLPAQRLVVISGANQTFVCVRCCAAETDGPLRDAW